jgi:signal transduction histidine kinase/DNA-binding NarL/FixJ family response regulator
MLGGGGEAAERIRRFDWASTPLGPMARWPRSLKTTVATMLHSRHPMFLWWGPELTQIYNDAYTPSFGVGKHPLALGQAGRACWPEIWDIIGPQIDDVMRRGIPSWHQDARVPIFRNGAVEEVFWTYGYSPVFGDDGAIAGTLVVCTETTDRVAALRELRASEARFQQLAETAQQARLAAESASSAKDDFLATASHELRTPLNAILGWARLLQSGELDAAAVARAIDIIDRNANAQVRLIEDILDGSRIISGKLQLEIRPLDMTVLVGAALDAVRAAAEAKRIVLTMRLDPAAARVFGDPDRLQQVIWNLVTNAIKFTPKDGTVDVSLRRVGTDIELRVRDSGEGIDPEFLPHVFERFRQADGSTTRRHGGLGLGLALVRHLVEAHGGAVRAASEGPGLGATFAITLPVQAVFAEAALGTPPGSSADRAFVPGPAHLSGVRVLVVDDEADARDLVATALSARGALVTTASSAAEALERLAGGSFAAMVSDVGMPDVDGYELVARVRAGTPARGVRLPTVALTAYSREEDRRRALEAGFDAHVAKPVEPARLVEVVAGIVQAAQLEEARRPAGRTAQADVLAKFERILNGAGIHDALRFLNSRTPHRFTGIYRFDPPTLRNVALLDTDDVGKTSGDDALIEETYCSIVGAFERPFATADTLQDERLRAHPARESVRSYCGVLLRRPDGSAFGTLCHFDLAPRDVPVAEMPLLEAAAVLIMRRMDADATGDT